MKVREDFLQGVSNCLWNKTLAGRRKLSTAECCGPRRGRWASRTAGVGGGGSERRCSYKSEFVCLRIGGQEVVLERELWKGKDEEGGQ